MRSIKAIGYDMDYTLLHYHVNEWEEHAYSYLREGLVALGWPVSKLRFDPNMVIRGLVIDKELGNIVKANRFGYVKRAFHGTRPLEFDKQRRTYSRTSVELRDSRWVFLNTFFAISEACMFMQLIDLMDAGKLPEVKTYDTLYKTIRSTLDAAHAEGRLKKEIIADPKRFVDIDPDMPLALLDQKKAGKKILLITNSEWEYAAPMLEYAFDQFLPDKMTWRDLFDFSIVGAGKPSFFSSRTQAFEVVDPSGLLRGHTGLLEDGGIYVGANAALVEKSLQLEGEEILYVGDHLFADVNVTKNILRWRTALVLRELENDMLANDKFAADQVLLDEKMAAKEELEEKLCALRIRLQRHRLSYGPKEDVTQKELEDKIHGVRLKMDALDSEIAPLAKKAAALNNPSWGPVMRAGNDKSHFARQVERYADIYTSRVSNFLFATPFTYLRSKRGSLPHD